MPVPFTIIFPLRNVLGMSLVSNTEREKQGESQLEIHKDRCYVLHILLFIFQGRTSSKSTPTESISCLITDFYIRKYKILSNPNHWTSTDDVDAVLKDVTILERFQRLECSSVGKMLA